MGITRKERKFVEEYAIDGNAVQSYFRAFGRNTRTGSPRSYKAAANSAKKLLEKGRIQVELTACKREHARQCGISARRVLRAIADAAFIDRSEAFELDPANGGLPKPRPLNEIPPRVRRQIDGIKIKRRRIATEDDEIYEVEEVEYKFPNRMDALEKLTKHLGLTSDGSAIEKLLAVVAELTARDSKSLPAASTAGGEAADEPVEEPNEPA